MKKSIKEHCGHCAEDVFNSQEFQALLQQAHQLETPNVIDRVEWLIDRVGSDMELPQDNVNQLIGELTRMAMDDLMQDPGPEVEKHGLTGDDIDGSDSLQAFIEQGDDLTMGQMYRVGSEELMLVGGIARGSFTVWLWNPENNDFYYIGERPDRPSDGMHVYGEWADAAPLPDGATPVPTGEVRTPPDWADQIEGGDDEEGDDEVSDEEWDEDGDEEDEEQTESMPPGSMLHSRRRLVKELTEDETDDAD